MSTDAAAAVHHRAEIGEESPVELALAAALIALPQMLSDNGKDRVEHNQRVR